MWTGLRSVCYGQQHTRETQLRGTRAIAIRRARSSYCALLNKMAWCSCLAALALPFFLAFIMRTPKCSQMYPEILCLTSLTFGLICSDLNDQCKKAFLGSSR
jgi:hypothetical protein